MSWRPTEKQEQAVGCLRGIVSLVVIVALVVVYRVWWR